MICICKQNGLYYTKYNCEQKVVDYAENSSDSGS